MKFVHTNIYKQLYFFPYFLMLFGLFSLFDNAWCGESIRPFFMRAGINLTSDVSILNDPSGNLTIQDILSHGIASRFTLNSNPMIALQSIPSNLWICINPNDTIPKQSNNSKWVIEITSPELDMIQLYIPNPVDETGYKMIMGHRGSYGAAENLSFHNYAFLIDNNSHSTKPLYLRLSSYSFNAMYLLLWKDKDFRKYTGFNFLGFGIAYGIMLCMIMHNTFIYISLKNRAYMTYVMYMLSVLAYFLCLNGHISFMTDLSGPYLQMLEFCFLSLFIIFYSSFCKSFCDTKENLDLLHKIVVWVQWVAVSIFILSLFRQFSIAGLIASIIGAIAPINVIWIGVIRCRQGFEPAKYFIAANIFLVAGIMFYVLWSAGLIPIVTHANLYFTMAPAIESILLSFALADRIRLLEREKLSLASSAKRYKKASETDALTGLFNKGYLAKKLNQEISESEKNDTPLSCLIMDVDNFKFFNDSYGHPEGDIVLKALAKIIKAEIRDCDSGCRYGGEEFTVIFPQTTLEQAFIASDRIRIAFESMLFTPLNSVAGVSVTVSMGLVQRFPEESADELIQRADMALYQAKHQGKNKVVIAS